VNRAESEAMGSDLNALKTGRRIVRGLLAVLGIIALVGGAEYLVHGRHRTHLHAAIPKICEDLKHERQTLLGAIEAYKRKLGFYPPDHVISRQPLVVDSVTNQLLYELLGTWHDPATDTFAPARFPSVQRAFIESFFGREDFRNTAAKANEVQHFLDVADIEATVAVHNKPDVAVLGYFPGWEGIEPDIYAQVELSSWRYNSSAPVHNPGAYDLWIEIRTAETNILIGNW
jgi:hypothetical protein